MVLQNEKVTLKWDRQQLSKIYYKVRQVLQSMTGCYYKVLQVLQSVTVVTKWDVTYVIW